MGWHAAKSGRAVLPTDRTLPPPTGPPPPKDNWSPWPSCRRNGSRSPVDHLKALITSCGWKRLPEFTLWWVLGHVVRFFCFLCVFSQIIVRAADTPSVPAVRLPHFGNSWELGICLFSLHYYARLRVVQRQMKRRPRHPASEVLEAEIRG